MWPSTSPTERVSPKNENLAVQLGSNKLKKPKLGEKTISYAKNVLLGATGAGSFKLPARRSVGSSNFSVSRSDLATKPRVIKSGWL